MDWRDKHPSKTIRTARDPRLWFGVEVEGVHHRGKYTAFVAGRLAEPSLSMLRKLLEKEVVAQVFFTETVEDYKWIEDLFVTVPPQTAVVVGRTPEQVPAFLAWRASKPEQGRYRIGMIVRLFGCPWIHELSGRDCITVGEPYSMRSYEALAGTATTPPQYEDDV